MRKTTVIKRCISCFLVLSFLNLTVAQGAMAKRVHDDNWTYSQEMDKVDQQVLVGSLVILAGLLVFWALKSRPSSDNQIQNNDTDNQDQTDVMSPVSNKTGAQSVDLAIIEW